jgi:WD40 repeat protein
MSRGQTFLPLLLGCLAFAAAPLSQGEPPATEKKIADGKGRATRSDNYGDPLPPGALARLGTTRLRHPDEIMALAYSPDRKVLAAADGGNGSSYRGFGWSREPRGSIRLWDPTTGKELGRLGGHRGIIRSLAFAAHGKVLISTGGDKCTKLWDLGTGKEITPAGGLAASAGVALSPDGKTLAVGSKGAAHISNLASGKEVGKLDLANAFLVPLTFLPDGKTLAVGFAINKTDRGIGLWDVGSGREIRRLSPDSAGWYCAFTPDCKTLATAGYVNEPSTIRVWDVKTGKKARDLEFPTGNVTSIALSPDGKLLAAVGNGHVLLWDLETGKELRRVGDNRMRYFAAAFAPDGKTLALSDSRAIRLFHTGTGRELLTITGHADEVEAVAFSPDGKTALTGGDGLLLWDSATGKQLAALGTNSKVGAATFASGGKSIIAGYHTEQVIRIWEASTGKELRRFEGDPGQVEFLGVLADGKTVVSGCQNHVKQEANRGVFTREKSLRVWDLETGKQVRLVADEMMNRATSSLDGRLLAGGMETIGVWDATTGRELAHFGKLGHIIALALAPDGRRLVSSVIGGPVQIWEVATRSEMGRLSGHNSTILSLAVSPDGRIIASGGSDGVVRLWDLGSGKELCKLEGHQQAVLAVAFSPDGRRLISGSRDTSAMIWDVAGVLPTETPARLEAPELKDLWGRLASPEGAAALKAVRRLARAPEQSLAHIRENMDKQLFADYDRAARLVADLDNDDFNKREAAAAELSRLGQFAEAALKRSLESKPSAELRMRAERLLKKLNGGQLSPTELQALRAVEVLELVGSPEARKLIKSLAKGVRNSYLGEEAKAAMRRLAVRQGGQETGGE